MKAKLNMDLIDSDFHITMCYSCRSLAGHCYHSMKPSSSVWIYAPCHRGKRHLLSSCLICGGGSKWKKMPPKVQPQEMQINSIHLRRKEVLVQPGLACHIEPKRCTFVIMLALTFYLNIILDDTLTVTDWFSLPALLAWLAIIGLGLEICVKLTRYPH